MSEKKPQGVVSVPIWGIFLLFLGIVFLLQTLNVLPWGLWGTLWRFWPALIIIVGLGILLRRFNAWLVSLLILAILGACLGIAIWQHGTSLPASIVTTSNSEPLGNIEQARIEGDFAAANVTIGSLPSSSSNFVEASGGSMNLDFHRQDSEGKLYLNTGKVNRRFWDKDGINWEIRLTRNIPLAIDVKSAAGNLQLNLSELEVTELRLDVDAGNCEVTMPSSAGTTDAEIEAAAANIEVTILDGVAARIHVDTSLSTFDVDESRFPRQGDYYISDDFDATRNRIYLEIDCDMGRVQVK